MCLNTQHLENEHQIQKQMQTNMSAMSTKNYKELAAIQQNRFILTIHWNKQSRFLWRLEWCFYKSNNKRPMKLFCNRFCHVRVQVSSSTKTTILRNQLLKLLTNLLVLRFQHQCLPPWSLTHHLLHLQSQVRSKLFHTSLKDSQLKPFKLD